jgi:CRP/FNR family transcriptional regulator, anaerobic regulatory protein
MSKSQWLEHFPALAELDDPAWKEALAEAQTLNLPAGMAVFREGDQCSNFLLVIDGAVRVQKLSESGREIVLYRVEEGQSCILTTACMLGGKSYSAEGYTETEVQAVALPHHAFQQALHGSRGFREFVFDVYAERVTELLMLIDAISFGRIDQRLAACLLEYAKDGDSLALTHQELARELGTAREVVSRLLKEFERRGWVKLGRGKITLQQRQGLEQAANVS